ncbi:MAG TPA: N-6 DNA methylase [Kofleriaceae bacterium]|nr:N-6 DNA methylase [Kofleriaceae bacterium]
MIREARALDSGLLSRCAPLSAALAAAAAGLDPPLLAAIAAEADARGVLSPELPGAVYERERAVDRGERRAAAIYYTPPHLVDFAVERALEPLCRERERDPLGLRVLDPACGGGAFLLAALRAVEERVGRGRRRAILGCLSGIDIDPQAAAVCRLALALAVPDATAEELARAVRVGDALAADSAPAAGFDAVVTNPPWGQKRFRLSAEERRRHRAAFASARGAIDPFALFVERAQTLLAPGGRWGMVLPDVILLKNHEPLRRLLVEGSALEWIAHAGRAFPAVNLDAVVMVGRGPGAAPPGHRVSIWLTLPPDWRERPPPTRRQAQSVFGRLPGCCLNLHLGAPDLALLDRLAALPRVGDRFEIHEGVHSGNARAKLFLPASAAGEAARRGARLGRLVVGRGEVRRYAVAWAGGWIDLAPGAIDRAAGDYANLGRLEWHRRAKILVRRTGDHLVAAHEPDGLHASNNLFLVLPRARSSAAALRAAVAVLNSRLLTWCFRAMVPRVGRLFAELKIQHLAALPHPPDAAWTPSAIAELDRLARRRAAAAPGPDAAELDRLIDERVESLCGLTPAERRHLAGRAAGAGEGARNRAPRKVLRSGP